MVATFNDVATVTRSTQHSAIWQQDDDTTIDEQANDVIGVFRVRPRSVDLSRHHVNIFLSCCLQAAAAGTGDWALRSAPAQHSDSDKKMTS